MSDPEEFREGFSHLRWNLVAENFPVAQRELPEYTEDEWDKLANLANKWHRFPNRSENDAFPWEKVTRPQAAVIAYFLWKRDVFGNTFKYTYNEVQCGNGHALIDGKRRDISRGAIRSALDILETLGCIIKPGDVADEEHKANRTPSHIEFPTSWWDKDNLPDVKLHPTEVTIQYPELYTNPLRECASSPAVSPIVRFLTDDAGRDCEGWEETSFYALYRSAGYGWEYDRKQYRRSMTVALKQMLPVGWVGQRETGRMVGPNHNIPETEWCIRATISETDAIDFNIQQVARETVAKADARLARKNAPMSMKKLRNATLRLTKGDK